MKYLSLIILFGCLPCSNTFAQQPDLDELNHINYITDPSKPKVIGSGDVVEETRKIDMSFGELTVGNGMQLYIIPDSSNNILIAAQAAILSLVSSEVTDSSLTIRLTASLETYKGIKLYVPIGRLSKITIKEGGYLHFPSTISAVDKLNLLLQSGALADCNINSGDFSCTVMGGATLNLDGNAKKTAQIAVKGGSVLNGKKFKCTRCNVTVLGASKCTLSVQEVLNARVENESSLVYFGNPKIESKTTKLNGKIRHKVF